MTTVELDRAQREAIREEIRVVAACCADIPLCFKPDRAGKTDRDYVVRKIMELQRWVAVLDGIGWQEQPDGPHRMVAVVDPEMASWASGQAVELESAFTDSYIVNVDQALDALTGLRSIAAAVA